MKNQTALITGSSGLIGTNLVELLLENSYFVVGVAKKFPLKELELPQFKHENYIIIEGDICDSEFINQLFTKYDPNYIIHLAAQAIVAQANSAAQDTFDVNIRGTWILMEAAKRLKSLRKIIVASSDKAYGTHHKLPYQEDYELNAINPYDISKKITEEIALSYFHNYQLPVTITRCGNVFGAYDLNWSRIVPGTILSCLNNEKIVLRTSGQQRRCYVYVKDVSEAYVKILNALTEEVAGEVFNVGNDKSISTLEVVEMVCDELEIEMNKNIIIENNSKYELESQSLSSSKIKNILGWREKYSIQKAMSETVNWYRGNYSRLSHE